MIVDRIIGESTAEEEKTLKIFIWTHKNIRKAPEGLPVIDDHVWHTIIRGYGINDQSSDVFTTLCNYASSEAFFCWIEGENPDQEIPLSFIKIKGRWNVFDPYNGNYFKNTKGDLAAIEDIIKGDWLIESIDSLNAPDVKYAQYFKI